MIDVVMITTLSRPDLFQQSLLSLHENCVNRNYTLTVVVDRHIGFDVRELSPVIFYDRLIINQHPDGASASRNIGASSIPKYRRQKYVMLCDDDIYACPRWDETLLELAKRLPDRIISGHGHPFNQPELTVSQTRRWKDDVVAGGYTQPLVISSVHMFMPWSLWDDVGYFTEPGGPGGSEDYDYCMRAKAKGYGFVVTTPQCIIHCGLTSSSGKPIVGYHEMVAQNNELIDLYKLRGKVRFE